MTAYISVNMVQVMACCPKVPIHHVNQCWVIISEVHWHPSEFNFTRRQVIIWTNDGLITDAYMRRSALMSWNLIIGLERLLDATIMSPWPKLNCLLLRALPGYFASENTFPKLTDWIFVRFGLTTQNNWQAVPIETVFTWFTFQLKCIVKSREYLVGMCKWHSMSTVNHATIHLDWLDRLWFKSLAKVNFNYTFSAWNTTPVSFW